MKEAQSIRLRYLFCHGFKKERQDPEVAGE